jgi:hypothetical protein
MTLNFDYYLNKYSENISSTKRTRMTEINFKEYLNLFWTGEEIELKRAKKIRNNHFVQVQARRFNSLNTVHDFLISIFWEIASDNEYPFVKNKKYINRRMYNHFIFVFLSDNDEIFYIEGLRDGAPRTAFDCLVALNYGGDDYAAALAIYRKSNKKPSLGTASYYRTPTGDIPAVHYPTSFAPYPIYPTFQPSAYGIRHSRLDEIR